MPTIEQQFSKMHGAGNDFIVMSRDITESPVSTEQIQSLCDRKRGIGADGIIFLKKNATSEHDVCMTFFNCDGSRAEMCGNGLRCAAIFANRWMNCEKQILFHTDAGILETQIIDQEHAQIELPITAAPEQITLNREIDLFFVNTGVPHTVILVDDIAHFDLNTIAVKVRYHEYFQPAGTNVNIIQLPEADGKVKIRTYERGVEDETSACGTGIAAAAISLASFKGFTSPVQFITQDNDTLSIEFHEINNMVNSVKLTGPAVEVFTGSVIL